ncbi:MAG TPA: hypothetical protein VD837_14395 [Terriglobales bacterium]|nr:hypothetical protein [Terriglobales bacterium]
MELRPRPCDGESSDSFENRVKQWWISVRETVRQTIVDNDLDIEAKYHEYHQQHRNLQLPTTATIKAMVEKYGWK